MKYIGTYSNDADIATKAKVDAKQDKVLVNGILKGDGQGAISAAETQEVELVTLTKADVGLGNVDNVKQYSATNPPPYPVTSVNSKTGAVELTASDVNAEPMSLHVMIQHDHYVGFKSTPSINEIIEFHKLYPTAQITAVYNESLVNKGTIKLVCIAANANVEQGGEKFKEVIFKGYDIDPTSMSDATHLDGVQVKFAIVDGRLKSDGTESWVGTGVLYQTLMNGVDVTAEDNGKFLRVVNGAWAAATVENANGVSF